MKSRIFLIFALFLTLTSFRSDEKAVKQNNTKILQRVYADIQPPVFILPLKDLTLLEGQQGIFTISVSNLATCRVTWYKNGIEIFPSNKYEFIVKENTVMLIIKKLILEDEGNYTVKVTNGRGEIMSEARLTVQEWI